MTRRTALVLTAVCCGLTRLSTSVSAASFRGLVRLQQPPPPHQYRRQLMNDRTPPPTLAPTLSSFPTTSPSTPLPSLTPSFLPTVSLIPTVAPSERPTGADSSVPTVAPSAQASSNPTSPTLQPSSDPTATPTRAPSFRPSLSNRPSASFSVNVTLQDFELLLEGTLDSEEALTETVQEYLVTEMSILLETLTGVELKVVSRSRRLQQQDALTTISYQGVAVFGDEPVPSFKEVEEAQTEALFDNEVALQAAIDANPAIGTVQVQEVVLEDTNGGGGGSDTNVGLIAGISVGAAVALALAGWTGYKYFGQKPSSSSAAAAAAADKKQSNDYEGYESAPDEVHSNLFDDSEVGPTPRPQSYAFSDTESMDAYSLTAVEDELAEEKEKRQLMQKLALYQGRSSSRSDNNTQASRYARQPSLERGQRDEDNPSGADFNYDDVAKTNGGGVLSISALGDEEDDEEEDDPTNDLFFEYPSEDLSDNPAHLKNLPQTVRAAQFQVPGALDETLSDVPSDEKNRPEQDLTNFVPPENGDNHDEESGEEEESQDVAEKMNDDDEQGLSEYLRERKRATRASRNSRERR